MDTNVYVKCMENTIVIFCIRDGGLFCYELKELETIDPGENKEDPVTLGVWYSFHCSGPPFHMAKILQAGFNLFHPSRSSMVSCKHIYLCDPAFSVSHDSHYCNSHNT